jgi:uncharacterized repeat protein (TIGR01451 family)
MKREMSFRTVVAAAFLLLFPGMLLAAPDLELRMSIDIPVPGPGQPVQFTVTLRNIGTDPATGVVVNDRLPAELAIPLGLAAFTSTGSYRPDTGAWTVGDMAAGATAVLVLPAIVATATQPPCSVNVAETSNSLDTQKSNDRAVAAVRTSANDRCVDLAVSGAGNLLPPCQQSRHLDVSVSVTNAGPDAASNVFVDLGQTPAIAPGLRFTNAGCSGTRCTIASIPAGSSVMLRALSSDFTNSTSQTLTLNFAASSSDTDYATTNNQTTSSGVVPVFDNCDIDIDLPKGSGVACFVATAAYGSPLEPQVQALREFRDRHLQQFALGRAFIDFYYRHSPAIADLVAAHDSLRLLVRAILTPLVLIIVRPVESFAVVMLLLAAMAGVRARRRRRGAEPHGVRAGRSLRARGLK